MGLSADQSHLFGLRGSRKLSIQSRQGQSLTPSQLQIGGIIDGEAMAAGERQDLGFVPGGIHRNR
jgi:hypothetical protein